MSISVLIKQNVGQLNEITSDSGGLANSPWPMFRQNLNHTGLSPYDTSGNPGKLKWSYPTGSQIRSSPAIDSEGTIYVGSFDYKLHAINPNGTQKWHFMTGGIVRSSPAICSDGTIYVGSDDYKLYAINPDGSKKWSFRTGYSIFSSPVIDPNGSIYVGSDDYKLYAINADGSERWNFTTDGCVESSPAIGSDGTIYIGSYDNKVYAINPDGTEKWNFMTGAPVKSSPAIGSNKMIYVGAMDYKLYAIKQDGTKKWEFATGSCVSSSPAIGSDGTIYICSWDNKLYAINPDGTEKWNFTTNDSIRSSPAIGFDGTIYIGSVDNKLYAINPNGSEKWNFMTDWIVWSSPAISFDSTIYIGSWDSKLYAIGTPISNQPPIANAGSDQTINESDTIQFSASASYDPDGTIESYEWDFESDGIYDYQETSTNAPDGAFDGKTEQIYGDNGVFMVTLRVTDNASESDTDTCTVTVNNLSPTITPFGPFTINEGSAISPSTSSTDPGSDDLTFNWDWGDGSSSTTNKYYNDGSSPDPYPSPLGTYPFSVTDNVQHTYGDDGVYTITLSVTDDDGGTSVMPTNVVVNNVAPIISVIVAPSGDEGSSLSFEANAEDPGTDDLTFSWDFEYGPTIENIYYNDGTGPDPDSSPLGIYPFNASDMVTHCYGDDFNYSLILTVSDDDDEGVVTYTTTIAINNIAPSIIELAVPYIAYEGTTATYRATAQDLGSDDLTFEWDFGDSTSVITHTHYNDGAYQDPTPSAEGIFPFTAQDILNYTYGDDYNYTLVLKVTDDDGGVTTLITKVYMNNVAPSIEPFGPFTIDEGTPLGCTAVSTDLGSDDLTFTWEFELGPTITNVYYNDGSNPDPYPSPWGTYPFNVTDTVTHTYGDNGIFKVTLAVADDDGGSTIYTTNIIVNNVAPTITPYWPMVYIEEGTPFTLAAKSTDQGSDDLTVTWELEFGPTITNIYYNNGLNPDPYPSPWGTYPVSVQDQLIHTYGDNGVYTITLTVEDDDGGATIYTADLTVHNVAPTIEPFGPFTVDEGLSLDISAFSNDPGSDDLTFTWEFELGPTITTTYFNDGVNPDPYPSPWGTYPFSISDLIGHTYGDNGVFDVTLTIKDDDGGAITHTTTITVENVAPVIEKIEAYMYVNISLRVAGEKYHSVDIYLFEDDSDIWSGKVTKYPGSPDEQKATIAKVKLDITKKYSAKVDYLPNDPRINGNVWGANPVWIEIEFENESTLRLHHTFNIRQSYRNSDHWDHIDPWEVELNPLLLEHTITFEARATDSGSDDLIFTWDFGDGTTVRPHTYFNNGLNPDPYPSPEINPKDTIDTFEHTYITSGSYNVNLIVEDDDGGVSTRILVIMLLG